MTPGADAIMEWAQLLRRSLEPGMPRDRLGHPNAAGCCLYAAVLVLVTVQRFELGTARVRGGAGEDNNGTLGADGLWHGHYWVEVADAQGHAFVVDITADQFGHPPVRVIPAPDAAASYRAGEQSTVDQAVQELVDDLREEVVLDLQGI